MKAKKITLLAMTVAMLALTIVPVFANGVPHDYKSKLWVGRDHKEVGLVLVDWIDDDTIRIIYETKDGCSLIETHLAVATCLDDIPQTNSGNPKIGHFPYSTEYSPPVTEDTYYVDVEGEGPFYIAAHAVVRCGCKCETAWAQGCNAEEFPGRSWALYFIFDVPPP
jgi:hypothetical protein